MNHVDDEFNLRLLRYLVSGEGVNVNISSISRLLDVHRATAKRRLSQLFDSGLLKEPTYPFPHIFNEYPLLALVKADLPRTEQVMEFIRDESHIFAAFSCMEGPYNVLLMEFFKDLESYHSWREKIIREEKLPSREWRAPADVSIFSNRLAFKYDPNCFMTILEDEFQENDKLTLGGVDLDRSSFKLMRTLMEGDSIRTNESELGRKLGSDRKTVGRRISGMIESGIIEPPNCGFPNIFIPPDYNLVISMIEIRSKRKKIQEYLTRDPNIAWGIETSTGRYNFLIFSAFKTIEHFFDWGDKFMRFFPECIGAVSNTLLSSRMIHSVDPQKLSLGWIERRLWDIKRKV